MLAAPLLAQLPAGGRGARASCAMLAVTLPCHSRAAGASVSQQLES